MTPIAKRIAAATLATVIAVPAEGLRQWAYLDPPGILTVCYGHTGPDVVRGRKFSLVECDQLLSADMKKAVAQVDSCVPGLPVEVLAAFSDAAYNLGPKIACDKSRSTAARLLANKDYAGACRQLPRWNKANVLGFMVELPGLTSRRDKEMDLCMKGTTA